MAIASIPYGFVRTTSHGAWHLGDQAAVISSFAGEGMAIALHSAHLAAACHLIGGSAGEFQSRMASDVSTQIGRATRLSHLLVQNWAQTFLVGAARLRPAALAAAATATRTRAAAALRRLAGRIDPGLPASCATSTS